MFSSITAMAISTIQRKPIEFYLKDFLPIPKHTVGMVSSRGGMGKTFLSLRIASEFVKETGRHALAWFSEDEKEVVAYRFDKLVESFGIDAETQNKIHYVTTEAKQFAFKENGVFKANYNAIIGIRKDCIENNIGLVIIDPLLAFYGGDENDNSQARIFMQVFLEWAKQDGINILFVHHAQKGDGSTRGASAFIDATRFAYELHYPKTEKDDIDFDKKDEGIRVVRLTKDNHNTYHHFSKLSDNSGEFELKILPPSNQIPQIKFETIEYKIEMPFIQSDEPIDTVTISIADHNDEHNPYGFVKKEVRWDELHDVITMGRAYAPASFKNGHRLRENYQLDTNVVFLDIDDGMTIEQAKESFKDLKCFLLTTRNHQKTKTTKAGIIKPATDRFRVVIKLDYPIDLADGEYQIAMQSIFDYFGNIDRSTKDPSRFYFSSPSDCEMWFSNGTQELNWRELYDKAKRLRAIEEYERSTRQIKTDATTEDIASALNRIDPDCAYQTWVDIGMALQSHLGDSGFDIWDSWSSKGRSYIPTETHKKWKSFKGGGISIGTLFYHSKGML